MEVLETNLKERLWHAMQTDVERYAPGVVARGLLMCPTCGRFLPYRDFSVEHIIPQQSLQDDPAAVKAAVPRNTRSSTILLCNSPLKVQGKRFHGAGCNSFKGKFYDPWLRQVINRSVFSSGKLVRFNTRHHVSLINMAYLAMVQRYGYAPVLAESGLVLRTQFFNPNDFVKDLPLNCQMVLMGDKPLVPVNGDLSPWEKPFAFSIDRHTCIVTFRGMAISLPISRHPEMPFASRIRFVPDRFRIRPDFSTVFE